SATKPQPKNWAIAVSVKRSPLLVRRGGCASGKYREASTFRAAGWSLTNHCVRATTPSAPSKVAARHFLMSRPPLLTRRGLRFLKSCSKKQESTDLLHRDTKTTQKDMYRNAAFLKCVTKPILFLRDELAKKRGCTLVVAAATSPRSGAPAASAPE